MASESVCALLAPLHQQHLPLPSPLQSTQGTCIRSSPQSWSAAKVPHHPRLPPPHSPPPRPRSRQSQARVWPEPPPPARPEEVSETGVSTELRGVGNDRVTFWGPCTQPSPLPFLAGRRARKPTPFSSEAPPNLLRFQSSPYHHLIHCSPAGQFCRKPESGTPQKPRAPLPVQLSPHGAASGPRTSLSAGRLAVLPEQNPVSGARKFPTSFFHPAPRAPHADPRRETRQPGGLSPDLRSRRGRPSLPVPPPPSSRPAPVPAPPAPPAPSGSLPQEEQTTFWTKFRSEQERLSLPRLLLTLTLRNRKERPHPPLPPKRAQATSAPRLSRSKDPVGSETTTGVCILRIFPETLPVPRGLQNKQTNKKTTSRQNQPR